MEHFNIISKKLLCRSSYCFCHKTNAGLDSPVRSDTVAIQICFCCRYGSEHDYLIFYRNILILFICRLRLLFFSFFLFLRSLRLFLIL